MRAMILLTLTLALAGCFDDKQLRQTLDGCPKVTARLGTKYEISRPRKIGSPGVTAPESLNGCTYRAHVEYPTGESYLYFSEREEDGCFHLYTATGQMRDVGFGRTEPYMAVTDVRGCVEGLR